MMFRSPEQPMFRGTPGRPLVRQHPFVIVCFFVAMCFLAIPVPLASKAHVALHGLCAQRPSHSFLVGGQYLPFDARMTGIYSGFLIGFVALLVAGRRSSAGSPSIGSGLILIAFLGAMAFDGFNSLFVDLRLPHPHEPDNKLRFLTGAGVGVGLAVLLVMLMAMTVWQDPNISDHIVAKWWEPLALWAASMPVGLLIVYGPAALYPIHTLTLVVSAVVAFSGLGLVCYLMITKRENSIRSYESLQHAAIWGLAGGLAAVGLLSSGRLLFEAIVGAPPLT